MVPNYPSRFITNKMADEILQNIRSIDVWCSFPDVVVMWVKS